MLCGHTPPCPTERWNCHDHRDELKVSDEATVYHPVQGHLCYCEKHWDCVLFYPIRFKDKAAAYRWIETGCIAELQEGLGILGVGFVTESLKPIADRDDWYDE